MGLLIGQCTFASYFVFGIFYQFTLIFVFLFLIGLKVFKICWYWSNFKIYPYPWLVYSARYWHLLLSTVLEVSLLTHWKQKNPFQGGFVWQSFYGPVINFKRISFACTTYMTMDPFISHLINPEYFHWLVDHMFRLICYSFYGNPTWEKIQNMEVAKNVSNICFVLPRGVRNRC